MKGKGKGKAAKAKGKGKVTGKGKGPGGLPATSHESDSDGPEKHIQDALLMGYERRAARVVAEETMKYTVDYAARCPLPGCDSKGEDRTERSQDEIIPKRLKPVSNHQFD